MRHRTTPALPVLSAAIAGSIFVAAQRVDAGATSLTFDAGASDARVAPLTRPAGDGKAVRAIADYSVIGRQTRLGAEPVTDLPELQSWSRDERAAADWVSIGADVIGQSVAAPVAPTVDDSFAPEGDDGQPHAVPLPGALVPGAATLLGLGTIGWWRSRPVR